MSFTDIFGGTTIASSNATFLSLALVSNLTLGWPTEQAASGNVVADTIEVVASAPGFNITFSDARQVSSGYTTLFNNVGGNSFNVLDANGGSILTVVSGTAWVVYLADNSTLAGTWRVFQLGASVSTAVAAALAGAGLKSIANSLNLQITAIATASTPVAVDSTYRAKLLNWIGGVGIANLPDPAVIGADFFVYIRNSGSGNFTLTPAAGLIDSAATKVLGPGSSVLLISEGTNYWSIGFGTGTGGAAGFDFVTIDVSASGTITLAGANLNRVGYKFTGVLTATTTIVVPGTIQEYWVTNATTGAFSLYVKTAAQANPGIPVTQGTSGILASDGNNVYNAVSGAVSFPLTIPQGGTSAVTAAGARAALGSTATGDAVFIAASQATARIALGSTTVGDAVFIAASQAVAQTAIGIDGGAVPPGGRLTLLTGSPVPSTDRTSTNIYYTPYVSDRVPLYNGTAWISTQFTETVQALADASKSPAAATANNEYDLFVWNDSGTIRCTRGPAWTFFSIRGTGAGTTELELFQGKYVNKNDITNGPLARRGLYVGTVRIDGSTFFNDSSFSRFLWNNYNRRSRFLQAVSETTDSWTYSTALYRQANVNTANQLNLVTGLIEDVIEIFAVGASSSTVGGSSTFVRTGIGLNRADQNCAGVLAIPACVPDASAGQIASYAQVKIFPTLGYAFFPWLEYMNGGGTATWYGDSGAAPFPNNNFQAGINGLTMM